MTLTNAVLVLALGVATAFQPAAHHRGAGRWIVKPLGMSDPSEATANQDGVILKSNLERTKEGFESTDTPDFFDDEGEGGDIVDNSMSFTKGSQGGGSNHNPGVAGALDSNPDVIGGQEVADLPDGVTFEVPVMAAVMGKWDGELNWRVPAGGGGLQFEMEIVPDAMTYEDFYVGFAPGAPTNILSIEPASGRLGKKGDESTWIEFTVNPQGLKGDWTGDNHLAIVVALPDDVDKAFKLNLETY